ncbi:MAG TPA: flavin reductase family protein, partial [Pseudomonadales bacterium]|nr:flavin reductase family protein [Pseudomonadales bacterium]
WLAWSCMLGLDASSQTAENILRTGECVLNLASADLVPQVDKIAKTTGRRAVPLHKRALGYRFEKDKFNLAGLTPTPSVSCAAPRVLECPVQLEAKLRDAKPFAQSSAKAPIPVSAFELEVVKVHVEESLLSDTEKSYVDPDKWHPLIMSFRKFYTTGDYIHPSRLAEGNEEMYAPWKRNKLVKRFFYYLLEKNTAKFSRQTAKPGSFY